MRGSDRGSRHSSKLSALHRRKRRRNLTVQVLENRRVLSAEGIPYNPVGSEVNHIDLERGYELHEHVQYDRDFFNNSDYAKHFREIEDNRGNELTPDTDQLPEGWDYTARIPDLDTLDLDYGPQAGAYYSWGWGSSSQWPDTPSPAYQTPVGHYARDGMDPIGTYEPTEPIDVPFPESYGRMADDYDLTEWFFDPEDIKDHFPQIEGWGDYPDQFVPSGSTGTTVTSGTVSVVDNVATGKTITYTLPWTLTVTYTTTGSDWDYSEELVLTGFNITTEWDFAFEPYGYVPADPANGYGPEHPYWDPYSGGLFDAALATATPPPLTEPGLIDRDLVQSGNYTFRFESDGSGSDVDHYSFEDTYADGYTDTFDENFDPHTLPFETEVHTYDYFATATRTQNDLIDITMPAGDPYGGGGGGYGGGYGGGGGGGGSTNKTYTESGSLSWHGYFDNIITTTWDIDVTGVESSFIDLYEYSTLDELLTVAPTNPSTLDYTGSGELVPNGGGNGEDKIGTRHEWGDDDSTYVMDHTGHLDYHDRMDDQTSNTYDTAVRDEYWDEEADMTFTETFDRQITYASGSTTVINDTQGTVDGDYWTEGRHYLDWHEHRDTGNGLIRDIYFYEETRDHSDPNVHIAPEVIVDVTMRVGSTYDDQTTQTLTTSGIETGRTGDFTEDGDAWLLRRLEMDGDLDMTGSGSTVNYTIDDQTQKDFWAEDLEDYYRFIFDEVTTYHSNGGTTEVIDEEGEADGFWTRSADNYYHWAAHSDVDDWTYEVTRSDGANPGTVGGVPYWDWLNNGGVPHLEPWFGAGTARRQDDWVYWYSNETTVDRNANGNITGRVGTIETDIFDPDLDADTIDGGITRTPTLYILHQDDHQNGGRDEYRWYESDYTWDPAGATKVTYHHESLDEWDEDFVIGTADSLATFNSNGSRTYDVNEIGETHRDNKSEMEGENDWYSTNYHEYSDYDSTQVNTGDWYYDDNYLTTIDSNGAVLTGTLLDWGDSYDSFREAWDLGDNATWRVVGNGFADADLNYNYTTTITTPNDPYGGGLGSPEATVTGSEVTDHSYSWSEDTYAQVDPYGGGLELVGSDGDSDSWQSTYSNTDFVGPRSGRERKFAWLFNWIRFWD